MTIEAILKLSALIVQPWDHFQTPTRIGPPSVGGKLVLMIFRLHGYTFTPENVSDVEEENDQMKFLMIW
jgi:hypothetical protein